MNATRPASATEQSRVEVPYLRAPRIPAKLLCEHCGQHMATVDVRIHDDRQTGVSDFVYRHEDQAWCQGCVDGAGDEVEIRE